MKWVHVLVDYDNAMLHVEKNPTDVTLNLNLLSTRLSGKLSSLIPDSDQVFLRLYGGWVTLDGQFTPRAGWLLSEMPNYRRKIGPVRIKPTIITTILAREDLVLVGTYQNQAQIMVDAMLSVDVVELASDNDFSLVVVSDDQDVVPAVITASEKRTRQNPVYWLRRRNAPDAMVIDSVLKRCNVRVAEY
jgi:hypothetical protein